MFKWAKLIVLQYYISVFSFIHKMFYEFKELCYFRDILINSLRFTSYELLSLRVTFIARDITSSLHMSNELLFIGRVMTQLLHTNHDLLFIARVKSYSHCLSYVLLFAYKLQVDVYHASY